MNFPSKSGGRWRHLLELCSCCLFDPSVSAKHQSSVHYFSELSVSHYKKTYHHTICEHHNLVVACGDRSCQDFTEYVSMFCICVLYTGLWYSKPERPQKLSVQPLSIFWAPKMGLAAVCLTHWHFKREAWMNISPTLVVCTGTLFI